MPPRRNKKNDAAHLPKPTADSSARNRRTKDYVETRMGLKILRSEWVENLKDPYLFDDILYCEGLRPILLCPEPEMCAAFWKHLEENNHIVWSALIRWIERRYPRRARGRPSKKERIKQGRAEGKSLSQIGQEEYPGLPKDVAKHNVDSLLRSGKKKPAGRIVGTFAGSPVYETISRKPEKRS